ncbi:MAG: response regulator transcription factor [Clostridium sp.]
MGELILVVEDTKEIGTMIKKHLTNEGYIVNNVFNGQEALYELRNKKYSLAIVDVMMPILNGFELVTEVRKTSNMPIIILSAKDRDIDKVLGLGVGADDYMTKPFSLIELTARVQAALRRRNKYSADNIVETQIIEMDNLYIDVNNYIVKKNGHEVKFTVREFEILKLLAVNLGTVLSKDIIYERIWGDETDGDINIINVHIRRIREKIEDDTNNPKFIKTIWGIGYKFERCE